MAFSMESRQSIVEYYHALKHGDNMTQMEMDSLVAEWEDTVQPSSKERNEAFALVRPDGLLMDITGPRWVFHLFGLRHRATEIALRTETGLIVLQRRSSFVQSWANATDMAVAGHIPQYPDGSNMTFLEGAWKEMEEEIGLWAENAEEDLLEGGLTPVGTPYFSLDLSPETDPPMYNAEVRQIFAATLTGKGLSRIRFADNEVAGILLVTPEIAWSMLERDPVASGMRYSLPRYLDWLVQNA